jgi:hypothetical protein
MASPTPVGLSPDQLAQWKAIAAQHEQSSSNLNGAISPTSASSISLSVDAKLISPTAQSSSDDNVPSTTPLPHVAIAVSTSSPASYDAPPPSYGETVGPTNVSSKSEAPPSYGDTVVK